MSCLRSRHSVQVEDIEPSVSFQLKFGEHHELSTAYRLPISSGCKEAKPLPVCVSVLGTSLWQANLSKIVPARMLAWFAAMFLGT